MRLGLAIVMAVIAAPGLADQLPVRPPKTYQLKNTEWHITVHPESKSIDGDVIHTLHLLKPEPSIWFDCGPLQISSITANGETAKFDLTGEKLTIQLPDQGAKLDEKIEIKYGGKPTCGIYFIDATSSFPAHTPCVYTVGTAEDNRYWLPTYDYPDNKATSEGYITVPKTWTALSNGVLVNEKVNGDTNTVHWKMNQPHSTYLTCFMAGPYEHGESKWHKKPVQYWAPAGLLPWAKITFDHTDQMIDFYSKLTGFDYPYDKFAQAAVPEFMWGGVENITCVSQSIYALFPPEEAGLRDSWGLVAHELAHQWFGDCISPATWRDTWLSESFATLLPNFYERSVKGREAYEVSRSQIYAQAKSLANAGPVAWTGFNYPDDIYRGNIYPGGAARLFMLMNQLGEPSFWKGIKAFLNQYKFDVATTEQFFAAMSKSSGQELTQFMNEWFLEGDVPHITTSTEGNSLTLTMDPPKFTINPEVWVWDKGSWRKFNIKLSPTSPSAKLDLGPLATEPFFIDPEGKYLLDQKSFNKPSSGDELQIFEKLPAFSRLNFINKISYNHEALKSNLENPKYSTYKRSIINYLGEEDSVTFVNLIWDDNPTIREAAIRKVRQVWRKDYKDRVFAALRAVETQDRYPRLREEAYAALMQNIDDNGMAKKAWTMDGPGDLYRVEALQWWADHDKVEARRLCLEALDKPLSQPVQHKAITLLGSLKDAPNSHVAYDHLVDRVKNATFGLRSAAIDALGEYGDPAALPILSELLKESLWMTRTQAKSAVQRLSSKN